MAALLTLCAAVGLVGVPQVLDRLDQPIRNTRLTTVSFLAGGLIFEMSLALVAAPNVLRALNLGRFAAICDRMLVHLGAVLPPVWGWLALVLLVGSLTAASLALVSSVRFQRKLRRSLFHVPDFTHRGLRHVLVDSSLPIAFGLGGSNGPVVLSTGLLQRLDELEIDVVLAHEAAHIRNRHPAFLLAVHVMERAALGLPWVERSAASARLAMERMADERAVMHDPPRRRAAAQALLKMAEVDVGVLPAMSAVDTVARRVGALVQPPSQDQGWRRWVGATLVGTPLVVAAIGMSVWASHGHASLAAAGICPTL